MEPVRLPDVLIEQEPRCLRDLHPGKQMSIVFTEFKVDEDRRCYLNANGEERNIGFSTIVVRRDADGNYHVDMPSDNRYKPSPLLKGKDILKGGDREFLPVASINIVEPR
jgi:hypothetical protein